MTSILHPEHDGTPRADTGRRGFTADKISPTPRRWRPSSKLSAYEACQRASGEPANTVYAPGWCVTWHAPDGRVVAPDIRGVRVFEEKGGQS